MKWRPGYLNEVAPRRFLGDFVTTYTQQIGRPPIIHAEGERLEWCLDNTLLDLRNVPLWLHNLTAADAVPVPNPWT